MEGKLQYVHVLVTAVTLTVKVLSTKSLVFVPDRMRLETTRWIDLNATDWHILMKN